MGYFRVSLIETEDGAKGKSSFSMSLKKAFHRKNPLHGDKKIKAEDLTKESGIKLYSI